MGLFGPWATLEGAELRRCGRGSVVWAPGDPCRSVYGLESGRIKIVQAGPEGRRLILELIGPGEPFGEAAVLGAEWRENAAEVLEAAAVWMIPRRSALEWLRTRPEGWRELATLIEERRRRLEGRLERVLFGDVEQRLVRLLLELAQLYGEGSPAGVNLGVELSQRELAQLVGSTRETVSAALNRLRRRGWVEIRRKRLRISSLEELARAAVVGWPPRRPPAPERAAPAAAEESSRGGARTAP